nr:MipA/OmpV family protein [Salinicola tamaricis]
MSASRHGVRLLALAAGLSTAAAVSAAQPTWEGSVGAGAIYAPDYLGSDDYEWNAWPSLDATYGNTFFVSVTDGIGWNLVREGSGGSPPLSAHLRPRRHRRHPRSGPG